MTAAPEKKQQWADIVALMRRDVRELGRDAAHAPRFLQRCTSATESLTSQLRRGWGINAHEMQAVSTLWEFGRMTMTELVAAFRSPAPRSRRSPIASSAWATSSAFPIPRIDAASCSR